MSDLVVLHIETKELHGQLIPFMSLSNKKLQTLPTVIARHITHSHLHHTETANTGKGKNDPVPNICTLYNHSYREHKNKYALVFMIPVFQSMVTLEGNEEYKNHLYIRIYIEGKYERRELKKYCRVDNSLAVMIACPAFLNTSHQYHILQQTPCVKNFKKYVDDKRLNFIDVYDVKDVKKEINKIEKSKSYVESVKTSADSTPDSQRKEGTFIKQLKYHYGPNVDVKMLSRHMTTHEVPVPQYQSKAEALVNTVHPQNTIHDIISKLNLQNYLIDENKCAIVATLHQPENFYKDKIVAFVLFRFVLPSKDDVSTEASTNVHILLEYMYVYKKYDEYVWDKKKKLESNGIRKQLLREAIDYVSNVFGGYDVFYKGKSSKTRDALQCVGFKPVDTEHNSSKLSNFMSLLSNKYPVLYYQSTKVQCHNWKECLALVKRRRPSMLLKEQLILAKKLQPNKRTKTSEFIKPKRSRRAVNVKEGKKLIEEYYSEKYLQPHDISLKSTKKELEDALVDAGKHSAILAYCKAVRNHLKQTRKSTVLLSKEKKNTWKFRPIQGKSILLSKIPEKYALEELNEASEIGRAMINQPFGRSAPSNIFS